MYSKIIYLYRVQLLVDKGAVPSHLRKFHETHKEDEEEGLAKPEAYRAPPIRLGLGQARDVSREFQ